MLQSLVNYILMTFKNHVKRPSVVYHSKAVKTNIGAHPKTFCAQGVCTHHIGSMEHKSMDCFIEVVLKQGFSRGLSEVQLSFGQTPNIE